VSVAAGEFEIKARMSGIFYSKPSPDSPPFVEVGTEVQRRQTVALLESMKLFTKIKSPEAGKVLEILATDGDPVGAGDVLVRMERM
jgi:acetyl-CoA carboxylase biotin carboxyl carrier protein